MFTCTLANPTGETIQSSTTLSYLAVSELVMALVLLYVLMLSRWSRTITSALSAALSPTRFLVMFTTYVHTQLEHF